MVLEICSVFSEFSELVNHEAFENHVDFKFWHDFSSIAANCIIVFYVQRVWKSLDRTVYI